MWDIGKNLGKERFCVCGETTEHTLECIKVREVIKRTRKAKKEWLESDKSVELVQVTEYIKKAYIEIREKQ